MPISWATKRRVATTRRPTRKWLTKLARRWVWNIRTPRSFAAAIRWPIATNTGGNWIRLRLRITRTGNRGQGSAASRKFFPNNRHHVRHHLLHLLSGGVDDDRVRGG